LGFAGLLLGGALIAPATRQWIGGVNWYRYLLTRWVLRGVVNGKPRALEIMDERCRAGLLTTVQQCEVIDAGLGLDDGVPHGRCPQAYVDLLGFLQRNGQLSSEQTRRFYKQMFRPVFELRPVVREFDEVPHRLHYLCRGPSDWAVRYSAAVIALRVNGKANQDFQTDATASGYLGPFQLGYPRLRHKLTGLEPGRHRVEIDVEYEVIEDESGEVLARHIVTCGAPIEVLKSGMDSVLAADASISEEQISKSIELRAISDWSRPLCLGLEVIRKDTPACGLSGYFTIRTSDGTEIATVTATLSGPASHVIYGASDSAEVRAGDWVYVTFTSDRALAREMLDVTEIWEGRLLFGPIEAEAWKGPKPKRSRPAPTSRPAWVDDERYYKGKSRRLGVVDGVGLTPGAASRSNQSQTMSMFRNALTSQPATNGGE